MILICEGPDGCGKSEIVKALSDFYYIPSYRFDKQHSFFRDKTPFKLSLEYGDTLLVDFMSKIDCDVVFDRYIASEFIYSKLYKRETNIEVLNELDRKLAELNTWYIICVRNDYSNCKKDEIIEQNMLQVLHNEYINFAYNETLCSCLILYVGDFDDKIEGEIEAIDNVLGNYYVSTKNYNKRFVIEKTKSNEQVSEYYRDFENLS